jgi:hypothetical protein
MSDDKRNESENSDSQKTEDTAQQKEITLPEEALDNDLIEKEWIEKAKEIIEHTKDDPYEQQRALSATKADYMKKRFNRDLNKEY